LGDGKYFGDGILLAVLMKNIRRFLVHGWQPVLLGIIAFCAVSSLLFFRLEALVPNFAAPELAARESSSSIKQIVDDPSNAPHKLGQLTLQSLGLEGPLAMRAISAAFGVLAVYLFFLVMQSWFTTRIAMLGSLLFATSSWFLHVARLATPDILQMGILALLVCGIWLRFSQKRSSAIVITGMVVAVSIYVPGFIWFITGFGIWKRRVIIYELRRAPAKLVIPTSLASLVLAAPLVIVSVRNPQFIKTLIGLPEAFIGWEAMARNFIAIPIQLFARGPDNPVLWLGRLPILDIFSAAMFVLGAYYVWVRRRLDRSKLLLGIFIGGSLLISLGGSVNLTMLLPFIYIIVTFGLVLMLQQWFVVFPRNPLARNLGVTLLSVVVLLSALYNLNHYFIAWPNAPQTKATFNATMEL